MAAAPLGEIQRLVLDACDVLEPVELPLRTALGHVLAADVVAPIDIPPFDNTAMDGYAVRSADCHRHGATTLAVLGVLPAGIAPSTRVGQGQALRIMTGAPIPDGADAVVMIEYTESAEDGRYVRFERRVAAGDHVRIAGSDVVAGSTVLRAGLTLTPAQLGLLASVGAATATVYRRPRVGVLSTGDELAVGPEALRAGQIRDSNRPQLLACLERDSFAAVDLGIALDDENSIRAALEEALSDCDAVITSGGVSVGDFDHVKAVLEEICAAGGGWARSIAVAIKPAKPFAFGVYVGDSGTTRKPVFGLPGNPVSSLVSYEMLARPALRAMAGHPDPLRPTIAGRAAEGFPRSPDGRVHLVRVNIACEDGEVVARSVGSQGSHQLAATAASDGLAVVPDGAGLEAGALVDLIPIDWP